MKYLEILMRERNRLKKEKKKNNSLFYENLENRELFFQEKSEKDCISNYFYGKNSVRRTMATKKRKNKK